MEVESKGLLAQFITTQNSTLQRLDSFPEAEEEAAATESLSAGEAKGEDGGGGVGEGEGEGEGQDAHGAREDESKGAGEGLPHSTGQSADAGTDGMATISTALPLQFAAVSGGGGGGGDGKDGEKKHGILLESTQHRSLLASWLPNRMRHRKLALVYSTDLHGAGLFNMLQVRAGSGSGSNFAPATAHHPPRHHQLTDPPTQQPINP